MMTMTIERDGIVLPPDIQERCGMLPGTSVRVIETRHGLLLVPLTDVPMSAELTEELQEWQELGQSAWAQFSYEDEA